MNKFIGFGIVCLFLVQIYVPIDMISEKENVLNKGKVYKFKTAPIDPIDPLRGKFVLLSFEENTFEVDTSLDWNQNQKIYLRLKENKEGFAEIASIEQEEPDSDDYLKAKVKYQPYNTTYIQIEYPFDRFYMEEKKAYPAEKLYRNFRRDPSQIAYATVSVLDGDAVLENLFINDVPIKEMVENYMDTVSVN